MASAPAVEVRDLVKTYGGRAVVDGLSFAVQAGEVFALLGPNGAGKTTTVEILEGYRHADAGYVRVLGLDPGRQGAALKPRIGLMLQQGGLFPQITAREALRLCAAFYREAEDPEALLDQLQLREVGGTRFRQLSGGQKQRLSLGLALIGKPHLVFLDEPTSAMDPQARRSTWNIIRSLRNHGTTVLLTTHFMDEAEQLANRVAIVDHGHLVALDTPAGLRQSVANEVRFVSDPPVSEDAVAAALALPRSCIDRENDGTLVVHVAPTPARIAELTAWLATQSALLTELRPRQWSKNLAIFVGLVIYLLAVAFRDVDQRPHNRMIGDPEQHPSRLNAHSLDRIALDPDTVERSWHYGFCRRQLIDWRRPHCTPRPPTGLGGAPGRAARE